MSSVAPQPESDVLKQNEDPDVIRVADQIKDYLETRPHAADSLEGVVGWWLRRQQFELARDQAQRALDYLVAGGIVKATKVGGDTCIYSLAREETQPPGER